ncbi:MAG TPA: ubiquitin-like small modifier protein 1 [Anaeromyxobacter sp.]|nr:ubiquitin-like small modifier protein 1 [Anaeromyxobacter sp.]
MRPAPQTVRVRLPSVLRPLAGGRPELRAEGATVGEVLRALGREHPELCRRLLDEDGRLRRYVTFFLNGEDVRHAGGADAAVAAGDELTVVPALSGGAPERAAVRRAGEVAAGPAEAGTALPALAARAEASPDEEICGFVLAGGGEGAEVVPVRNVAPDRRRGFAMEPREVLAALRAAEERGRDVTAIFHSHPAGGAGLSGADLALLAPEGRPLWPGVELWVVALEGGKAVELRAHAWAGSRYEERFRRRAPFTER